MEGDGEEEDMDVVAGDHGVIHGEVTRLEVVAVLEALVDVIKSGNIVTVINIA